MGAVIQTGGSSELLISLWGIAVHSIGTTAHPCTSWEPHWTRVKLSPSSRGDLWCAWSNHFRQEHGAMTPEGASRTPWHGAPQKSYDCRGTKRASAAMRNFDNEEPAEK